MAAGGGTTTEAGRRLRDMMDILRKRAPRLRPNTVPRSCWPFFDDPTLASWAAAAGQRKALAAALAAERRKVVGSSDGAAGGDDDDEEEEDGGVRLALVAEVDPDAGVCHIQGAKYVSEVEADLHSVARILNLHSQGESDELRLRLEHFLSVNGYPSPSSTSTSTSSSDPLREAQEIYSLAYAISVCLGAAGAAIRAVVGPERVPLPLAPGVDAGALVGRLFAAAGGAGKGKGKGKGEKRKGGRQEEEEEQEEQEQEGAGGGGKGGKKRRRKGKGKGGNKG